MRRCVAQLDCGIIFVGAAVDFTEAALRRTSTGVSVLHRSSKIQ